MLEVWKAHLGNMGADGVDAQGRPIVAGRYYLLEDGRIVMGPLEREDVVLDGEPQYLVDGEWVS